MAKGQWLLMTCLLMGCDDNFQDTPIGSDPQDMGDAGTENGDTEARCDSTMMPDEDPCVIQDDLAVFVSPRGSDFSGCGTMSAPCASLGRGMRKAKVTDKRVYACGDDGPYEEHLTIDIDLDGLVVLGGFRCADWSYEPSAVQAQVLAPVGETALEVEKVSALEMRDFVFESEDATTAGTSSVAARVRESEAVRFTNTVFRSGRGAAGRDGTDGQDAENAPMVGDVQKGKDGVCNSTNPNYGGVWLAAFACAAGGETLGGRGGNANYTTSKQGKSGYTGEPGQYESNAQASGEGKGGLGGTLANKKGKRGADGSPGKEGEPGLAAASAGEITATGYTPADGQDGMPGWPGQGGGGGGGSWSSKGCVGPSGGAGGLGGCGGFPGTKGGGGGASIALLVWQSDVTLHECDLMSAAGGKGGNGGNGGAGSQGWDGASGGASVNPDMRKAGDGGRGGDGGLGGSGSGGTGGPSFTLVYQGKPPTEQGIVSFSVSAGGVKGFGGQAPGGAAAPDGTDGKSAGRYQVQ